MNEVLRVGILCAHNTIEAVNRRGNFWVRTAEALRGMRMSFNGDETIRARLTALSEEHRDLDAAIDALIAARTQDQLKIARLKKRKLALKDQIHRLEIQLTPDIIA